MINKLVSWVLFELVPVLTENSRIDYVWVWVSGIPDFFNWIWEWVWRCTYPRYDTRSRHISVPV